MLMKLYDNKLFRHAMLEADQRVSSARQASDYVISGLQQSMA